jgi:hypothetical protein
VFSGRRIAQTSCLEPDAIRPRHSRRPAYSTIVCERQSTKPATLLTVFQPICDGKQDRVLRVFYAAGKVGITCASGRTIETTLPPD